MAAGSMRERAPQVWELRIYLGRDPVTGKVRSRSVTHRGGKRSAADRLRALQADADAERAARSAEPEDLTVAELLDRWLQLRRPEWATKTAHDHQLTVANWIVPHLGDEKVVDLRRARIEEFYAQLADRGGRGGRPLSATSVRKAHSVLHAALEDAVRMEVIAGNPAAKARRPKVARYQPRVPSLDQVRDVVVAADPMMATLIRLAIATGARRGELVALRWSDIDLDAGTVHIQRSVTKLPGQRAVEKPTKTGASAVLAIDAGTVAVLRSWWTRTLETRLRLGAGRPGPSDWLFPSDRPDEPISPETVTYRWKRLAAQLGLDGVRLHDLRHAAATHMIAAGVDVRTVAGRLRHSSPAMTLDVYASRDLDADRDAAHRIGGLLDG